MKKALVILAIMLAAGLAYAADFEIDKGAVELGGSAGFASYGGDLYENSDGDGITTFSIQPEALYFVIKGLGIGGVLGFESQSQGDYKSSIFGIGPAARYYFGDADSKIFPYLGAEFLFQSFTSEYPTPPTGTDKATDNMTSFVLRGGAAYKLVDHFTVSGGIFYEMDSYKPDNVPEGGDDTSSGSVFGISIGFSGFIY